MVSNFDPYNLQRMFCMDYDCELTNYGKTFAVFVNRNECKIAEILRRSANYYSVFVVSPFGVFSTTRKTFQECIHLVTDRFNKK